MKTPYLDSQLKGYRQLAESGKMPESGMEQLRELEAIKEALSIHIVSCCSKDELKKEYDRGFYEGCEYARPAH